MSRITTVALVVISVITAAPASAITPLRQVVDTITTSGGRYKYGSATLRAADCSGIVSVAQTLAMGQSPHRLGDTHSLLAGHWPGAIPGATPDDLFIIGATPAHMVARIDGVNIESRSSGELFRIGGDARSPFDMPHVYHIDPRLLIA